MVVLLGSLSCLHCSNRSTAILHPKYEARTRGETPFVYLTNSMTSEEWERFGLDDNVCAVRAPNIQLARIGLSTAVDEVGDVIDNGAALLRTVWNVLWCLVKMMVRVVCAVRSPMLPAVCVKMPLTMLGPAVRVVH